MSEQVGSLQIDIDLRTKNLLVSQRQAESALDSISDGISKVEGKSKTLNTQLSKVGTAVKSNLSPAIRNASFQIADLATQLQMGGNALQAFAVQGAQLLAGFGTMGAVAGAVVAIAGAMSGNLANGADTATNSVEALDSAIQRLNDIISVNEQGVAVMSDKYASLAQTNAEVAKQMRNMAEIQAIAALRDLKEQASQAQGTMSSFWRSLQGGEASAAAAAQALNDLGITTNDYKEAIAILNANQPDTQAQMATLAKSVMYVGEEYDLTNQQAYEFIRALDKAATTKTPEAMQELSGFMQALLMDTENGNAAFRELAVSFIDAQSKGAMLEEQIHRLKGALNDAATEARNANFTRMLDGVAARLATIEQGWEAGLRMQMKAQGYTEEQIDELINMETAYRDAKAAQDAKNKAERESIALAKRKAAENDRIAKQEKAKAERDAKQLAAQKEQAGRFTQQVMTEYQTTVDPRTGQALNPAAQIDAQEQQKIEALRKYRALGVLEEQQYQDALTAIQETATMRRLELVQQESEEQRQAYMQLSNSMGSLFGTMADTIGNSLGEQSGAYRAMFAVQQAFTIASAMMSTHKAMADAMAEGATMAQKIAGVSAAASLGASIISAINSITFSGRRYNGGAVAGGSMYRVGENKVPELFQTNNGRQYMIPGENGRIIPGRDIGGGGGLTMNNTFNIQANNGWTEQDSKALQQTIENTAMRLMQRESTRPGGMLAPRRK
ncbi:hypothetical protein IOC09_000131 [Escherichia coli]|nr:hypothetical protein [Escherichia coli]